MDIEQGTVFAGQSIECSIFHKILPDKIANKTGQQYSKISNFQNAIAFLSDYEICASLFAR